MRLHSNPSSSPVGTESISPDCHPPDRPIGRVSVARSRAGGSPKEGTLGRPSSPGRAPLVRFGATTGELGEPSSPGLPPVPPPRQWPIAGEQAGRAACVDWARSKLSKVLGVETEATFTPTWRRRFESMKNAIRWSPVSFRGETRSDAPGNSRSPCWRRTRNMTAFTPAGGRPLFSGCPKRQIHPSTPTRGTRHDHPSGTRSVPSGPIPAWLRLAHTRAGLQVSRSPTL